VSKPAPNSAIEVFYSYAHEDEPLRDELEKQLSILKRQNLIRTWHDRQITAGAEWGQDISDHLNTADLILLLISANFIASDYCWDIELQRAIQRHDAGEACVIPIILRAVEWRTALFSKLKALPTDGRAVTSWPIRDEAFADIAKGISGVIEKIHAGNGFTSNEMDDTPDEELSIPRLLPYLCNRSQQERELSDALQRHQRENPRRPFVCIIPGDDGECHQEFLDRMELTAIPRMLNLESKHLSMEEHQLPWAANRVNEQACIQAFTHSVARTLVGDGNASMDEVMKSLAANEKPLVFVSHLLTEDFVESDTKLLTAFLKFWETWPALPPGRTLISCVCLKYQRFDSMSWLTKWRMNRLDDRLRAQVNSLDFSALPNVDGVVLSELKAIRRTDAEDWTRIQAVRAFCQIQEREIRALYQQPEDLIPMEKLAEQLRDLVKKCRRQRGDE